MVEVERNSPCPCGSGKKYKKCCGSPVPALPLKFMLPQLTACLLKHIGGAAEIDVSMIQSIPANLGMDIKQAGDKVIMKLVLKENKPELVIPEKKIIV